MSPTHRDEEWMRAAIQLGTRGLGQTWPNPAVGCLIVKNGAVVGRGSTQPGGRPHAEVVALDCAGDQAAGADVYVSLEPCAHFGETPPCAKALVEAGVARVFIGTDDPDPRVSGSGAAMIENAGIAVFRNLCRSEAERANIGFLTRIRKSRPFVTLKLAVTLDGRIATASGESKWITGPSARRRVHSMRASHDAMLVGRGTALADDPMLDVRGLGALRNPVRVVLDSQLSLPQELKLFSPTEKNPTWVFFDNARATQKDEQLKSRGLKMFSVPSGGTGGLELSDVLSQLGSKGITRVLCEGGATLASSLLTEALVDEIVLFSAGCFFGGEGLAAVAPMPVLSIADAPSFQLAETQRIGEDTCSIWRSA